MVIHVNCDGARPFFFAPTTTEEVESSHDGVTATSGNEAPLAISSTSYDSKNQRRRKDALHMRNMLSSNL